MRRRTNAAVAKWLEKQEWYEAWIDNMNLQDFLSEDSKLEYILGLRGEETICDSITWAITPEGYDYWEEINRQFKAWFYGEE